MTTQPRLVSPTSTNFSSHKMSSGQPRIEDQDLQLIDSSSSNFELFRLKVSTPSQAKRLFSSNKTKSRLKEESLVRK